GPCRGLAAILIHAGFPPPHPSRSSVRLPRTTFSVIAERIRDDTLSAAYVPRREPRPANAAAATPTESVDMSDQITLPPVSLADPDSVAALVAAVGWPHRRAD